MNRDREILLDLIRACNLIQEFCKNLDFLAFSKDLKTQSSVLSQTNIPQLLAQVQAIFNN